ncbi:hypothetical protein D043_4673B, partial [Vibrio parahaemolyticus EKP-021]
QCFDVTENVIPTTTIQPYDMLFK